MSTLADLRAGAVEFDPTRLPSALDGLAREIRENTPADADTCTPRDEFAAITAHVMMIGMGMADPFARLMGGGPFDAAPEWFCELTNETVGEGPISFGYFLADLAKVLLNDPLDSIPVTGE